MNQRSVGWFWDQRVVLAAPVEGDIRPHDHDTGLGRGPLFLGEKRLV